LASTAPVAGRAATRTVRVSLTGHVQGVGFRPFVYRIARARGLTGHVLNKVGEVEIIASGPGNAVDAFVAALIDDAPPLSRPRLESVDVVPAPDVDDFTIVASEANADAKIFVPPDYFMCDDCRAELEDPQDRRYRYPFINCTQCGPRYTLIAELPYDRPNTSMAGFPLCDACRREYEDPADRRFHAEPVACPDCGPRISFTDPDSSEPVDGEAGLAATIEVLRRGGIVAVKGVGGYHLMCDASDDRAVSRLRARKHRPDKPLAVMFPLEGDDGLAAVARAVELSADEAALLSGPVRPIVLARKNDVSSLADGLAPGLAELGVFLPYAPLHQLLLSSFGGPLVATSGNISGEPVLTDNEEAAKRLDSIADAFLHHDRPILRPADDPVYRPIGGRLRPLRIGRGTAPLELTLPFRLDEPVLAVGAHMKGTVAVGWDDRAVISPHIGEMDSPRSLQVFERVVEDLQALYGVAAQRIVCDAHPGYATHRWAMSRRGMLTASVWHHHAHASALAGEFAAGDDWLVFAWDGVGLGSDGTLWGGETLHGGPGRWSRVGTMRSFRLPGGERAGREPWRSAAALHWECGLEWRDCPDHDGLLKRAWERDLNAPRTTAVGRLFDAAGALVCDAHNVSYEAQAPMLLEATSSGHVEPVELPLSCDDRNLMVTDWAPLLALLTDTGRPVGQRAACFHTSMAEALTAQVREAARSMSFDRIGLVGGVFQNRLLTDAVLERLDGDYPVAVPESLPCNDAAISFGQLVELAGGTT
jgi:hydrogenase maturation protein HypF